MLTMTPSIGCCIVQGPSRPLRSGWSMPLCEHHPALQWLPTKLAEWIGKNLQDDLGFPDKADPGRVWTPTELNNILDKHIVKKGIDWDILQFFNSIGLTQDIPVWAGLLHDHSTLSLHPGGPS